jgi:hypothetical protein
LQRRMIVEPDGASLSDRLLRRSGQAGRSRPLRFMGNGSPGSACPASAELASRRCGESDARIRRPLSRCASARRFSRLRSRGSPVARTWPDALGRGRCSSSSFEHVAQFAPFAQVREVQRVAGVRVGLRIGLEEGGPRCAGCARDMRSQLAVAISARRGKFAVG